METKEFLSMSREDQLVWLNNEIWNLKSEVANLLDEKIKNEFQFADSVKIDFHKKRINRVGYGNYARPILKGEIEEARKLAKSEAGTARMLGVSYSTYKKWCKYYNIYTRNSSFPLTGIKRSKHTRRKFIVG